MYEFERQMPVRCADCDGFNGCNTCNTKDCNIEDKRKWRYCSYFEDKKKKERRS